MKISTLTTAAITLFLAACNPTNPSSSGDTTVTKAYITELIDPNRPSPKSAPVAVYDVKLPNTLNDWHFKVKLYETKQRFVYRVAMKYEEITGEDKILFPNLGFEPQPQLRKGAGNLDCMVGFLDGQQQFREYKLVSVKNNTMKISTIKSYAVKAK